MKEGRTYIVGDIHGCIDELNELLKVISFSKNDLLISVGDNIDRGPDSVGTIKKLIEINAISVKGNHENKFLRWYRGNKYLDEQKFYSKFSDEEVKYIANMPLYYKINSENIIIHAGMKPNLSIENQKSEDLMYLRYTDADRKFISLRKINDPSFEKIGLFWTEFGPFDYNIFYGHNVHSLHKPLITDFVNGKKAYGLDTGACFGGHLTAIVFETKEIIQIKAKQEYFVSTF